MSKAIKTMLQVGSKIAGATRGLSGGVKYTQDDMVFDRNRTKLVIGDGNLMGSVLDGVIKTWTEDGWEVDIVKVTEPKNKREGVRRYYCNGELPSKDKKYGEIWFGVKPDVFKKEGANFKPYVDEELTVGVSPMAGMTTDGISGISGISRVVRTMPNTNSAYRRGQTGITTSNNVPEGTLQRITNDFRAIGSVYLLPESSMNAFTILASSSVAAFNAISDDAYISLIQLGYKPNDARNFVIDAALNPDKKPFILKGLIMLC